MGNDSSEKMFSKGMDDMAEKKASKAKTDAQDERKKALDAALQQIEERQYAKDFADDYDDILCYGIAFYKKRCLVKKNHENCS